MSTEMSQSSWTFLTITSFLTVAIALAFAVTLYFCSANLKQVLFKMKKAKETATQSPPANATIHLPPHQFILNAKYQTLLDRLQSQLASSTRPLFHANTASLLPSHTQVLPGLLLGTRSLALDIGCLKKLSVSGVLFCSAPRCARETAQSSIYRLNGIAFRALPLRHNVKSENILPVIDGAVQFIDSIRLPAAASGTGNVYVTCADSLTLSPVIVLAYLLIRQQANLEGALEALLSKRWINPSAHLLRQLVQLAYCLEEEKGRGLKSYRKVRFN